MSQENISSGSDHLLYKLLKAIFLDKGAAIRQGMFGFGNPKLRFYRFTNTESPELLQFFFPEKVGLAKLRITSPDAFGQENNGCDLTSVYDALRNQSDFDTYWKNCMEWVEGNLANSSAVQVYYRKKHTLPKSKEDLEPKYITFIEYEREDESVSSLNKIFSEDLSVRNFMDAYGGGTVMLNDVTSSRQDKKDEIAAIVSISMIWLAQLGASDAGCTSFRNLLYEKIRDLFLEDDPRSQEKREFHETTNTAYQDMLDGQLGLSDSAIKEQTMVDLLGKDHLENFREHIEKLMHNLPNHADISSDNVKRKILRNDEQ